MRKPKHRLSNWLINLLLIGMFAGGAYFVGKYAWQQHQLKQDQRNSDAVASRVISKPANKKTKDKKPDPGAINIDWKKLHQESPNIVAWVYVPNTTINFAILQAKDNSYYLKHDMKDNPSLAGEAFLDYRQNQDLREFNNFFYAHYMYDGTKFAELNNYANQKWFEAHKNVYIYTPEKRFDGEVFATQSNSGTSRAHSMDFSNQKEKRAYIDYLMNKSLIKSNIDRDSITKMVTLWTCTEHDTTDDNGNYVSQDKARTFVSVSIKEHQD